MESGNLHRQRVGDKSLETSFSRRQRHPSADPTLMSWEFCCLLSDQIEDIAETSEAYPALAAHHMSSNDTPKGEHMKSDYGALGKG